MSVKLFIVKIYKYAYFVMDGGGLITWLDIEPEDESIHDPAISTLPAGFLDKIL